MKTLILVSALAALASASVGPHGGAVLSGPSGVVTSHGAIGPNGLPNGAVSSAIGALGWGHGAGLGAVGAIAAPVAVAAPAGIVGLGAGIGLGHGGIGGLGLGYGAGIGGLGLGYGAGIGGLGHGAGIVTNGGGTIGLSGHGVAVRGPPTAPAVISGPSGKIAADGLWGPTATWATGGGAAYGGYGGYGHGGHGW